MEQYIDMRLPSGTLWKSTNENQLLTFADAYNLYLDQIPTLQHFNELIDCCDMLLDHTLNGIIFQSKLNKERLYFSFDGLANKFGRTAKGHNGYYWTSDVKFEDLIHYCGMGINRKQQPYLGIYSIAQTWLLSVRLIKNERQ